MFIVIDYEHEFQAARTRFWNTN